MRRALDLAASGRGGVEPNPMVGCVVAHGAETVGEGWHRRFGGPHAEVEALAVAGPKAAAATMYVTLEPCCHQGKTPPCTWAIRSAGVARVVAAMRDPYPPVDGGGLAELQAAGIAVQCGVLETEARRLNAPYLKLLATGRPWVIAKWAMTLDGKLATHNGSSQWISGEASREVVHALRGRVDAVIVGSGTASADDPLLTARPPGLRTATRIVLDTQAALSSDSRLVRTAAETPVMVVVGSQSPLPERKRLADAGCDVLVLESHSPVARLKELLAHLGTRRMTNVLVEGGSRLLGAFMDAGEIDEVHAFIAPKLIGGQAAKTPIAGEGLALMSEALLLDELSWQQLGDDLYVSGVVRRDAEPDGDDQSAAAQ